MSDEPDMTVYYSAGWVPNGEGRPNPHLPGGDAMDRAVNTAISEHRVAEREREQKEAEQASHFEDLERRGQARSMQEVFERAELEGR